MGAEWGSGEKGAQANAMRRERLVWLEFRELRKNRGELSLQGVDKSTSGQALWSGLGRQAMRMTLGQGPYEPFSKAEPWLAFWKCLHGTHLHTASHLPPPIWHSLPGQGFLLSLVGISCHDAMDMTFFVRPGDRDSVACEKVTPRPEFQSHHQTCL